MHADKWDENVVFICRLYLSSSSAYICVHLRLEILELTGLGVSPGEKLREAGRLRNGLARDAPATIHPRANPFYGTMFIHPRANPFHGTMFTRSPARVRVKSLAALPSGTRMQPCDAG